MKQDQIAWLRSLDPKRENGSIEVILSEGNLEGQSFEGVLKVLLKNALADKKALMKENKNLSSYLKKIGHYNEESIFGEK